MYVVVWKQCAERKKISTSISRPRGFIFIKLMHHVYIYETFNNNEMLSGWMQNLAWGYFLWFKRRINLFYFWSFRVINNRLHCGFFQSTYALKKSLKVALKFVWCSQAHEWSSNSNWTQKSKQKFSNILKTQVITIKPSKYNPKSLFRSLCEC